MSITRNMRKTICLATVLWVAKVSPGLSFTHSHLPRAPAMHGQASVKDHWELKVSKKDCHDSLDAFSLSLRHNDGDGDCDGEDGFFSMFKFSKYTSSTCKRQCRSRSHAIPSVLMSIIVFCATTTMMPNGAMADSISDNPPPFFNIGQNSETVTNGNTSRRPSAMTNSRYWDMVRSPDLSEVQFANERLMDHAIGTINTMYYDNTGGAKFNTKDMYDRWRVMKTYARDGIDGVREMTKGSLGKDVTKSRLATGNVDANAAEMNKSERVNMFIPQLFLIEGNSVQVQKQHRYADEVEAQKVPANVFDNRDDAVKGLKWLVSTLEDPYSKYLTRDELMRELKVRDDGFLGLGVVVEAPAKPSKNANASLRNGDPKNGSQTKAAPPFATNSAYLTSTRVSNLPIVTAIVPDSPAERAGIVVGDRIAAVGSDNFVGFGIDEIAKRLEVYTGAENYIGHPDLTIAKPVKRSIQDTSSIITSNGIEKGSDTMLPDKEELIGYKLSRVRLPTASLEPFKPRSSQVSFPDVIPAAAAADTNSQAIISGGDSIVHWELLTNKDSIFSKYKMGTSFNGDDSFSSGGKDVDRVGYIRLTRFSRASTAGYVKAVEELEKAGAQSYIIDVRNNYGGIIQESMLTASSLLRDPHTVLCYTLNSRGGFTPHDVEEYVVDKRYPGYLLSSEPPNVSYEQVKREDPDFITGNNWVPPSSYASLHEQKMKRNYNRPTGIAAINPFQKRYNENLAAEEVRQLRAQKKIAILMNEGTASAAEVFVSSLRDNGRTVALVGTKTYGKGLIQHTFPMIDGGGLRMTVAEYLTPSLQHVTKVGEAQYDRKTGEFVGGGVKPDIYCPSTQGIPSNVGADICVGVALDALEDASDKDLQAMVSDSNNEGRNNGRRRTVRPEELERKTKPLYQ